MRRPKGQGSIYWSEPRQRYVGVLEIRRPGLRRTRKTFTGQTRGEVLRKLSDARQAQQLDATRVRLDDYLDGWLQSRDVTGLRQATRESYTLALDKHVRPFLGDLPLGALTTARLDDWLDRLSATPRTVATIRYAKVVLRIALQRAVRRGVFLVNPCAVLRVKGGTPRAPAALESGEVDALLEAAPPWLRVAILISAVCGLRRGEVCGLQWDDVDWLRAELRVQRSVSAVSGKGEPKTAAGRRTVQLPAFVVQALEGHRRRLEIQFAGQGKTPAWLFPADGKPRQAKHPRNFLHAYERARTRAGLEGTRFHDLRHTCATTLIELGTDIKAVSQMLGHADVRTTLAMYHHPRTSAQRQGVEAMRRWLKDGSEVGQ